MMEELKEILIAHAERYPLMQPADAVKLIYQNEFGGGHLIRDEQACLRYLRQEYDSITKYPDMPLCEEIGSGIVRVHLAAVRPQDLEQLGHVFVRSAASHTGSMERFLQKLEVLRLMTGRGIFSFGLQELECYLSEYRKAGCPAVSHSEAYRKSYDPAYRVVLKNWR